MVIVIIGTKELGAKEFSFERFTFLVAHFFRI